MKTKTIAYWIATILVALPLGSGGIAQLALLQQNVDGFTRILHYPSYFVPILGFWKVAGAIVLLVPGFPRLKEWAYAGIFIDLTGAAASWVAIGGSDASAFHILAPLFIAALTVASWALRPPSRILDALSPATNSRVGTNATAANTA
jgi:uncharacterized membrane protein YphA (DoxX/SURF4 family)